MVTSRTKPGMPMEEDLIAFDHSAAGHEGMSSNASGSLVIKPCTQAEIDFYESSKHHEAFQAHMPTFMGVLALHPEPAVHAIAHLQPGKEGLIPAQAIDSEPSLNISSQSHIDQVLSAKRVSWKPSGGKKLDTGLAIVMENVVAGFKHPNILDVKLGARLWADDAPQSKRRKLDDVAKATTSSTLGFRVAGMKLWQGNPEPSTETKNGYKSFDKNYGRDFHAENVHEAFETFLGGTTDASGKPRLRSVRSRLIAQRILRELQSIQYVLEHEESRMYSASILMAYEGDADALELALREEEIAETARAENEARAEQDEEEDDHEEDVDDDGEDIEPKVHEVRLIDFAHAEWTPGKGPDENALQGVRSVIRIVGALMED